MSQEPLDRIGGEDVAVQEEEPLKVPIEGRLRALLPGQVDRVGRQPISPLLGVAIFLAILGISSPSAAWSNGGYSSDPTHPDYGTHDWIAQHALDWLPAAEKQYIVDNLAAYLYGTELPDNGGAPDGIGDQTKHHVYYYAHGVLQDDGSALRASQEFENAKAYLTASNYNLAAKTAGIMSHYIVDVAVFGHVMGTYTDWGAEVHHSDYEGYVTARMTSYTSSVFDPYLAFDETLDTVTAYSATLAVAYDTTFGDGAGTQSCTWMDANYDWSNAAFKDSAGASLNRAVNALADVLHTLAAEAVQPHPMQVQIALDHSSGTVPLTVAFTSGVTGGIAPYTYSWSFGDGGSSTLANPTHTYQTPGTFAVTLTVTDSQGTMKSATTTVTATAPPLGLAVNANPTSGTVPLAVSFTSTITGGLSPFTYAWTFGDGGTSSVANPTYTYQAAGAYTATLTVADSLGTRKTASMAISVSAPAPPLTASMAAEPMAGTAPLSVSFSVTVSGGTAPYTYSWDFGDGGTSVQQNPTHTYQIAKTYTVRVTVTDAVGRTVMESLTVTVNPATVTGSGEGVPPGVVYLVATAGAAAIIGAILFRRRMKRRPR